MTNDLLTTDDSESVYVEMRPDQRTAIGEEFIRLLRLSNDLDGQHLAAEVASTFAVPASFLAPEQVVALHRFTRDRHPDLFAEVMRHPVTTYALAALAGATARAA